MGSGSKAFPRRIERDFYELRKEMRKEVRERIKKRKNGEQAYLLVVYDDSELSNKLIESLEEDIILGLVVAVHKNSEKGKDYKWRFDIKEYPFAAFKTEEGYTLAEINYDEESDTIEIY